MIKIPKDLALNTDPKVKTGKLYLSKFLIKISTFLKNYKNMT